MGGPLAPFVFEAPPLAERSVKLRNPFHPSEQSLAAGGKSVSGSAMLRGSDDRQEQGSSSPKTLEATFAEVGTGGLSSTVVNAGREPSDLAGDFRFDLARFRAAYEAAREAHVLRQLHLFIVLILFSICVLFFGSWRPVSESSRL